MSCYFIATLGTFSQDKINIGSLIVALDSDISDSVKVSILNDLYFHTKYVDSEKALNYAQDALILAESINYFYGKSIALNYLGQYHLNYSDFQRAANFFEKALEINLKINNKKGVAFSYNNIGSVYDNLGDFEKALDHHNKALKITLEIGDASRIASTYANIGIVYDHQGNYELALENYMKALSKIEELNDTLLLGAMYNNIGEVYRSTRKYNLALEYYTKSLQIKQILGDKRGVAMTLNNQAILYYYQGNIDKTLELFYKSLDIREEIDDKKGIAQSYSNIGEVLTEKGEVKKAVEYLNKALKTLTAIGDRLTMTNTLSGLGNLYLKMGNELVAIKYYRQGIELAKGLGIKEELKSLYHQLSSLYENNEQYKKAFEYHQLYTSIKDSIFNNQSTKSMNEMQAKYESEKNERDIDLKNKQNQLQEITLDTEQNKQYSLFGGLGLFILLVLGVAKRVQSKQKANKKLTQLNNQVQKYNQDIEKTNIELEKLSMVAKETDNSIVIMNKDTEFQWVNEAFTRIEGYTLEEYKKQYGSNLLEASTNKKVKSYIEKCLETKRPQIYESLCKTKEGKELWMHSTLTPIIGADKVIEKLVVIDTEITQQKEAENQLSEKVEIVTQNIKFAHKIQSSLLENEKDITKHLPDSFLIYKPKDIVSGDFYYFTTISSPPIGGVPAGGGGIQDNHPVPPGHPSSKGGDILIYAAVDCTGHGVPGAMVSMLGINILNRITKEQGITNPGQILHKLHDAIKKDLRQDEGIGRSKDGMDMSICTIYPKEGKVLWAGAGNPIYIGRKNVAVTEDEPTANVEVTRGDIYGIGGETYKANFEFKTHELKLEKGDSVYLLSDGLQDQFGGKLGKRFSSRRLRQMISNNLELPMQKQKEQYEEILTRWQGKDEQIDDITLIGFRI